MKNSSIQKGQAERGYNLYVEGCKLIDEGEYEKALNKLSLALNFAIQCLLSQALTGDILTAIADCLLSKEIDDEKLAMAKKFMAAAEEIYMHIAAPSQEFTTNFYITALKLSMLAEEFEKTVAYFNKLALLYIHSENKDQMAFFNISLQYMPLFDALELMGEIKQEVKDYIGSIMDVQTDSEQ